MNPTFVGVTGLPRAGSTLLCQMLAQHPEIECEGLSSPLCNLVLGIRRMISNDRFFLAQLANNLPLGCRRSTPGWVSRRSRSIPTIWR
jgi:sulfotransferase